MDREPGLDIVRDRIGDAPSGSLPEPPGDLLLDLSSFLVRDLDLEDEDLSPPPKKDSSSTDVAAVAIELDRDENFIRLPSAVMVVCVTVDDLLTVDLDLLCPLIDPPKKSPPLEEPGRVLNRFRDMASSPNICARERKLAVGVDGAERLPVRNLKSPNWCTMQWLVYYMQHCIAEAHTCLDDACRHSSCLNYVLLTLIARVTRHDDIAGELAGHRLDSDANKWRAIHSKGDRIGRS